MRINEESINHNAMRKIKEITDLVYDVAEDNPENKLLRDSYLYTIAGIVDFAEEMKKAVST